VGRRRVYILPTRQGLMFALLLVAMLIAALNYNSNLALAFAFLMISVALVAMHHCNRNLLGLVVDADGEADAFAGGRAEFRFALQNGSALDRPQIEVRCGEEAFAVVRVPAGRQCAMTVGVAVRQRGVTRFDRFELRTRHPFGWFRAWTFVQSPLTAYVAPAPRGERPLQSAAEDSSGDEDFDGLRTYQAGLPLKLMAWKVLARGGEAAVRRYTAPAPAPEWLDWSALPGLEPEERLAQLCRWVLESDAARRRYGLRLPGREIPPADGDAQRHACLRALASYGGDS
jgi:uncharacterized protein (DUF58 family)